MFSSPPPSISPSLHVITLRDGHCCLAIRWLLILLAVPYSMWALAAPDSLIVTAQVSSYHSFQVSCFGMKDGWIDLTISGGEAPFSFKWSTGAATEDLAELAAGYYKVDVIDHVEQKVTMEFTLEQPLAMKTDVDVYEYPNGYNISCYECNNGNASVVVMGGAAPFSINWSDGPVGAVRYNLGPKDYRVTVSDANGCEGANTTIYLRGPDRSDWSMVGNPGTTPGPHYIGTPDNKDVVFKSNGQERLRLKGNGDIGLFGSDTTAGMLYRDWDGVLKIGGGPHWPTYPTGPCAQECCYYSPIWHTTGNSFPALCPDAITPRIGSLTNTPVDIITNDQVRMHFSENGGVRILGEGGQETMRIDPDGQVAIGTLPPIGPVSGYRLYVENGIATRDVLVKQGEWPDYVFAPEYELMPLSAYRRHLQEKQHLPGIPSALDLEQQGGVELGAMQERLLKALEEQALYILQLEERLRALENNTPDRKP